MACNAITTQGVTLAIDKGQTATFDSVAEVKSLDGPSGSTSVITATSLNSEYACKYAGIKDSGQVSVDLNYVVSDDGQDDFKSAWQDADVCDFKITLPDDSSTKITFTGLVTEFSLSFSEDDVISASTTIEISGAVDFDAS